MPSESRDPNELERVFQITSEPIDGAVPDQPRVTPYHWEKAHENLVDGMAEAIFDADEDQIDAELRAMGDAPDKVADDVRSVLLDAVDSYERSGGPVKPFAPDPASRGRNLPS